jgi:DNA replication protein DnaC
MKKYSEEWLYSISLGRKPYWCTLLGTVGTGKTYLATQCIDKIKKMGLDWYVHKTLGITQFKTVSLKYWPSLIMNIRQEGYGYVNQASDIDILFLDDFGAEYKTDFGVSALNEIFNRRLDKWTFITSNLGMQDIYNEFDARIASRLKRGENTIIQTNAIDFDFRQQQQLPF